MNKEKQTIQSFADLDVWKEGHKLVLMIYRATKHFPKEELFGLTSQMRRCAVSITSNIAEGFSRQSYKEKIQFYYISRGSITELQNQLIIAHDVTYLSDKDFDEIAKRAETTCRIMNGLIKKSKEILHS